MFSDSRASPEGQEKGLHVVSTDESGLRTIWDARLVTGKASALPQQLSGCSGFSTAVCT